MPAAPRPAPVGLQRGRHGMPREEVRRHQRARMLEAIVRAVSDNGYAATSVQDVWKRAGVSSKTFYEHFGRKEDCFLQAYDAVVARVMEVVTSEYSRGTRWPNRVERGLSAFLRLVGSEDGLARMALVEVLAAGPRARKHYQDAVRGFIVFYEPGRAESPHPERLPARLSEAVVGGITATLYHHLVNGQGAQIPLLLPDLLFCSLVPYLGHARAAAAAGSAVVQAPAQTGIRARGG